jgi:hypothetical protein
LRICSMLQTAKRAGQCAAATAKVKLRAATLRQFRAAGSIRSCRLASGPEGRLPIRERIMDRITANQIGCGNVEEGLEQQ